MRLNYLSMQDIKIILYYLGNIMIGVGAVLMVPIIVDVAFREFCYPIGLIPPLISMGLGYFCLCI